jgi:chromosomal replication initiator protein
MHPLAAHFMVAGRCLLAQERSAFVPTRRTFVSEIQEAVVEYYSLTMADMMSDRRAVRVARPRQLAMSLCKNLTLCSLPDIGRRFGNRDHSTVIHAVKRIAELRAIDENLDADYIALHAQLTGKPNHHT